MSIPFNGWRSKGSLVPVVIISYSPYYDFHHAQLLGASTPFGVPVKAEPCSCSDEKTELGNGPLSLLYSYLQQTGNPEGHEGTGSLADKYSQSHPLKSLLAWETYHRSSLNG